MGVAQGLVLRGLFEAATSPWAFDHAPMFAALAATLVFAPLVLTTAFAHLRPVALAIWLTAVAVVCAGIGAYDLDRAPLALSGPRSLPSPLAWLTLSAGLFVAHSLVLGGAADGRFIGRYRSYFDVSWKLGLQLLLAALCVGVFWSLLNLGNALFMLIRIRGLDRLIGNNWFIFALTMAVFHTALHITDVRTEITAMVRRLVGNLLSWLLPMMTLLVAIFVLALPATGLEPLWATRYASVTLLAGAANLVLLINAAYQDGAGVIGEAGPRLSVILRGAIGIAGLLLLPLTLCAGYAIALRVGQYGWTPDRIFVAAGVILAGCYATGYLIAILRGGLLQPRIDATNIATAFVALALLLALFSPVADPARISVADQMRLLRSGRITAEALDYQFLRFDAGRYGLDALRDLAEHGDPATSQRASAMLQRKSLAEARRETPVNIADNVTVVQPPGATLPRSFVDTDWRARLGYDTPACLARHVKCRAVLYDIDGDGRQEVILLAPATAASIFTVDEHEGWSMIGTLTNTGCSGVEAALLAGRFELAPPDPRRSLIAGGVLLNFNTLAKCPAREPAP